MVERADFERAVQALEIGWTSQSAGLIFSQLDNAANQGRGFGQLQVSKIDEACCLGCKSKFSGCLNNIETVPQM